MLRVREHDLTRSTGNQIAEIVQGSLSGAFAVATPTTLWARPMRIIATSRHQHRFWQVFNTSDFLGLIRPMFFRFRHDNPPWCD